jgi:16S rRNA (cytidine1402-2'-O)-methyltransferase
MTLYIISTPIGNLEDVTLRALRLLKEVDLILAEDTRQTGKLLNRYEIKNSIDSYNDHNKERKTKHVIKLLQEKKEIAIVSDSGTPGISDPGFYLIRECVKNDLKVVPVPGANAVTSALVSSGLATDKFKFMGFLPKKIVAKEHIFNEVKEQNITTIFYESPHRIIKTLKTMKEIIPDREICVAREMTKKFEELIRGNSSSVYERLKDKKIKGEITIVIGKF